MASKKTERVKNPYPAETPVQIKKRIKATASPTLAAASTVRVKAGPPGPAAALPSGSEARKPAAKKTPAKRPAAKKAAEKKAESDK